MFLVAAFKVALNIVKGQCFRMEVTRTRSAVKSILWRAICILVSVITSYLLTGKWDIAVAIGLVYNVINIVLYYFHERIWNRVKWGIKTSKNRFSKSETS